MTRLTHVAPVLRVADLSRSLAYYCDCLGFDVEFVYEATYASVVRDACRIHLKCSPPSPRDQSSFEIAEHIDVYFGVERIDELAKAFTTTGAVFSVHLRAMPYGREFYVQDPDGYILGFVQSRDES
jgi:catechol 2,3-dioxygenase-like lactoylglutathione lyase family enzyme